MWCLKYQSYFPFRQKEIWCRHLICSVMVFKHLLCNTDLARDEVADVWQFCTSSYALMNPRSGKPLTPWPQYQTPSPSFVLGPKRPDHSSGLAQAVSTSIWKKCQCFWSQKHSCWTQIYQAVLFLPLSWEAVWFATGQGSKCGAAGPSSHSLLPGPQPACCLQIQHDVERKFQSHSTT